MRCSGVHTSAGDPRPAMMAGGEKDPDEDDATLIRVPRPDPSEDSDDCADGEAEQDSTGEPDDDQD